MGTEAGAALLVGRQSRLIAARRQHAIIDVEIAEWLFFDEWQWAEGFRMGVDAKFEFHQVAVGFGQLVEQIAVLGFDLGEFPDEGLVEFLLAGSVGSAEGGDAGGCLLRSGMVCKRAR